MVAVIAVPEEKLVNDTFTIHYGEITAIANTPVTMLDIDAVKPHCFVGLQFFQDADGDVDAFPTGGSTAIAISTVNNEPNFEAPPVTIIQAFTPTTLDWSGNTVAVRATHAVTPSGGSVAFWRLVVTTNES